MKGLGFRDSLRVRLQVWGLRDLGFQVLGC